MRRGTSAINFAERARLLASVGLALTVVACGGPAREESTTKDIYSNDDETRREATSEETLWTVYVDKSTSSSFSFCTGSMLSSRYLLTANHCSPRAGQRYKSGSALVAGTGADMEVVRVAERSSSLDYAIVEIRWLGGEPPRDQKFTPFVSTSADDLKLGLDGEATMLETVGFPADKNLDLPRTLKPVVVHAVGYAKRWSGQNLLYNVGSINGNSGGAVWRADDHMLVSMTNSGPHQFGQRGWKGNDPENPRAWNNGAAMHRVYQQSKVLRELFPQGDNSEVDDEGNLTE